MFSKILWVLLAATIALALYSEDMGDYSRRKNLWEIAQKYRETDNDGYRLYLRGEFYRGYYKLNKEDRGLKEFVEFELE